MNQETPPNPKPNPGPWDNIDPVWKARWGWFTALLGGSLAPFVPYWVHGDFGFRHYPGEAYGTFVLTFLGAIGLLNSKKPSDH